MRHQRFAVERLAATSTTVRFIEIYFKLELLHLQVVKRKSSFQPRSRVRPPRTLSQMEALQLSVNETELLTEVLSLSKRVGGPKGPKHSVFCAVNPDPENVMVGNNPGWQ